MPIYYNILRFSWLYFLHIHSQNIRGNFFRKTYKILTSIKCRNRELDSLLLRYLCKFSSNIK